MLIAGICIIAGYLITFVMGQMGVSELGFLFNAAYMGGFAIALYVPLTLYINRQFLPKSDKPSGLCTTMMIIASLVYVSFAIASAVCEIGRLIEG